MKKIIILLLTIFLLTGCGSDTKNYNRSSNKGSHEISIKLDVKEGKHDSYLVFFMPRGAKKTEVGAGTAYGFLGPHEIKKDGVLNLNVIENYEFNRTLNELEEKVLEVYVSTPEDYLVINPLNKKLEIKFIEDNRPELGGESDFFFPESELIIPIVDKYPDGVISLPYQDATFVIKLNFEEDIENRGSFEVSIHWDNPKFPGDIGVYRTGRVSRSYQYWEVPFFKDDLLAGKTGKIVVRDFDTYEVINYPGHPKSVSFDKNGKCTEGDIINIKMP